MLTEIRESEVSSSIRSVLRAAGLAPMGVVEWSRLIPVEAEGVYVVSTEREPSVIGSETRACPIDPRAIRELLDVRPELSLDRGRPSPDELGRRISEFWLQDENILYIGLARTLSHRVNDYYGTPLGSRRPHAGGWFLKVLRNMDALFVHYATCSDRQAAESDMIKQFCTDVSSSSLKQLRDPAHPFPFANLEWPPGTRKGHGIRGAKAPKVRRAPQPPFTVPSTSSVSPYSSSYTRPDETLAVRGRSVPTQRVTEADLLAGRIRIPRGSKSLLPGSKGTVEVDLRGVRLSGVRYDPSMGPPERSGVLRVGSSSLRAAVHPNETLRLATEGNVAILR